MAEDATPSTPFLLHVAHRTSSNMVRELPTLDTNFIRARCARVVPSVASRGAHPARTRPRVFGRPGVSPETRRREILSRCRATATPRRGEDGAVARHQPDRSFQGIARERASMPPGASRCARRSDPLVAASARQRGENPVGSRPARSRSRCRLRRARARVDFVSGLSLRATLRDDGRHRPRRSPRAPATSSAHRARFLGFCQEAGLRRRVRRLIRNTTSRSCGRSPPSIDPTPNIT